MYAARAAIFLSLLAAPAGVRTCHYSFWSDDPSKYLEAIHSARPGEPLILTSGESLRAAIVTHHFLASGLMVRCFSNLRDQSHPSTVILIGPNHFHHGRANISVSSLPWKTPFGMLETDGAVVQQVKSAAHLPEDPEAFAGEHSVGVLTPFVKYYFPAARVVTILIDVNARQDSLRRLHPLIAEFLANPHLLVILSMDFSHDSIASVANSRDAQSQAAILALDFDQVKALSVDCPRGLWLLLSALRDLGHVQVQLGEHTNSAQLTGNLKQPDVTSYFTMYFIR